jgi:two-component system, OmpR family, sensor kinase
VALSLRARLAAATGAATLAATVLLVVGLQLLLARQSDAESGNLLRGRVDAAASTVRFTGRGVRVLETPSRVLDQEVWIYDASGVRVDGSPPPPALRRTVEQFAGTRVRADTVVSDRVRVYARPLVRPGTSTTGAVVVAALDLRPYETGERRSLWLSLALGALSVVAAGVAAWVAAGSSLRHVRWMARRADDWREHDLSGRFALGPPRDELTELAHTLDRMLDRIGQALLAERRLSDEVAHELRTPLSVIRTEAQLALSQVDDRVATAEALEAVVAATGRMDASISTMLAAARSTQREEGRCRIDETLAEALSRVAAPPGVTVAPLADLPDATVAAPSGVVGAALSPLLDNALRHARRTVRVHAAVEDDRVRVTVADDGAGVPAELREEVFRPGHSTRADGTGLGLSLARRLARSVGGDITVGDGPGGVFVVTLPRE